MFFHHNFSLIMNIVKKWIFRTVWRFLIIVMYNNMKVINVLSWF